jgi:hypothetical protein
MINEVRKGIDIILGKNIKTHSKENQIKISLNLIDITVENTEKTIKDKITFFLQKFLHFTDRHSTEIQLFNDSNQRIVPV